MLRSGVLRFRSEGDIFPASTRNLDEGTLSTTGTAKLPPRQVWATATRSASPFADMVKRGRLARAVRCRGPGFRLPPPAPRWSGANGRRDPRHARGRSRRGIVSCGESIYAPWQAACSRLPWAAAFHGEESPSTVERLFERHRSSGRDLPPRGHVIPTSKSLLRDGDPPGGFRARPFAGPTAPAFWLECGIDRNESSCGLSQRRDRPPVAACGR